MSKEFWITLTLIGGAIVAHSMNKAGEALSITITKLSKPDISGGAVKLSANIAIDNPTNTKLSIKKPNLKAYYNGDEVGNSIPTNEIIKVAPNGRTPVNNINIQVPLSNLPSVVLSLFNSEKPNLSLKIVATTEVNGIPYTTEKEFEV